MSYRVLGQMILWLTVACLLCVPPASWAQFIARPSQTVGNVGSIVVFAVTVTNAPNAVQALGFDVTFDPSILQYQNMFTQSVLVADWGSASIPNSGNFLVADQGPGRIRVGGFTANPDLVIAAGSSGAIVLLEFMVLAAGDANLAAENLVDDVVGFTFRFEQSPTQRLFGISTRSLVQIGEQVQIGGFIINGDSPKTVLIRALGPSLIPRGVVGALANPLLQLFSGQTLLETNDNWRDHARATEIAANASPGPPTDDLEAAILVALPPGPYTAIVSGVGGTTGVALIEVFEAD